MFLSSLRALRLQFIIMYDDSKIREWMQDKCFYKYDLQESNVEWRMP